MRREEVWSEELQDVPEGLWYGDTKTAAFSVGRRGNGAEVRVLRRGGRERGLVVLFSSSVLKNRELQIMRKLDHCNIVRLRYFFYSSGEKVRHWGAQGEGVASP